MRLVLMCWRKHFFCCNNALFSEKMPIQFFQLHHCGLFHEVTLVPKSLITACYSLLSQFLLSHGSGSSEAGNSRAYCMAVASTPLLSSNITGYHNTYTLLRLIPFTSSPPSYNPLEADEVISISYKTHLLQTIHKLSYFGVS